MGQLTIPEDALKILLDLAYGKKLPSEIELGGPIASARVNGSAGTILSHKNCPGITKIGTGNYQLDIDEALSITAVAERYPVVMLLGGSDQSIGVDDIDGRSYQIQTRNTAGSAVDAHFRFLLFRMKGAA